MTEDGWIVSWPVHGIDHEGRRTEVVVGLVSEHGRLDVGIRVGQDGPTVLLPRVEAEQDIAIDLSATLRKAISARMKSDGEL